MYPSDKARLMLTFRGRMQLAREAAEAAAPVDPWQAVTSRLKGEARQDGFEYITTAQCLDELKVALHARNTTVCQRLNHLMKESGWQACRIPLGTTDARLRGYKRQVAVQPPSPAPFLG
jgi:hypothetical protein